MLESKNNEIDFKFKVTQGDNLLMEKSFQADCFNPPTRYSVDIRDKIPSISNRLQSCLSRRNKDIINKDFSVDTLNSYIDTFKLFSNDMRESKLYRPREVEFSFGDKTIHGVPCRFGLYINDKPIVERDFYVRNYNPNVRFTFDLYYLINEIVDEINTYLITLDRKNTWEDFDIINKYGYSIQQIRDMSKTRRSDLLKRIA